MNLEKESLLKNVIQRAIDDNKRIAEQNLARAERLGEPLIDPAIARKFENVCRVAAGKPQI